MGMGQLLQIPQQLPPSYPRVLSEGCPTRHIPQEDAQARVMSA